MQTEQKIFPRQKDSRATQWASLLPGRMQTAPLKLNSHLLPHAQQKHIRMPQKEVIPEKHTWNPQSEVIVKSIRLFVT